MSITESFATFIRKTNEAGKLDELRAVVRAMDANNDNVISADELGRIDPSVKYDTALAYYNNCKAYVGSFVQNPPPVSTHVQAMANVGTYWNARAREAGCLAGAPFVNHMTQDQYTVAASLSMTQDRELKMFRDNPWVLPFIPTVAPGELASINRLLEENGILKLDDHYIEQFQAAAAALPARQYAQTPPQRTASPQSR